MDFQVGTGRMPMAQPGGQALRKAPVYDEEEIEALAAYVASLGPGPSVPEKNEYDGSGVSNEDMVRGGEFFRTNCTACHNFAGAGGALPRGRFAPGLTGVSEKHMFEAMLTGPQQMPVFSDEVLTPEDKKQIIAYLKKNEETPNYGGFTLGSLGPVSEGLFTWLVGIGGLVGFAVWIAANPARSTRKKQTHERQAELSTIEHEPFADPGLPAHDPDRPTSTKTSRSAPSARSPRCSGSPRSSRCCSACPTSTSRSATIPTRSSGSGPPTWRWADPRAAPSCASGSAPSSGPAS